MERSSRHNLDTIIVTHIRKSDPQLLEQFRSLVDFVYLEEEPIRSLVSEGNPGVQFALVQDDVLAKKLGIFNDNRKQL